jgi:hypothetical protein
MATKSIKTTPKTTKTSAPKVARASKSKSEVISGAAQATPPAHATIAVRAYERFCTRGHEHGHDVEDWLAAERDLTST